MAQTNIVQYSLVLLDKIFQATAFPDHNDAEKTFADVKEHLQHASKSVKDIETLWKKFCSLGMTVSSQTTFNDMIKIIWRMVREKKTGTKNMFCLYIVGITALLFTLRNRGEAYVEQWEQACVQWLGNQLTIGGKGVTGEGEGSTWDRIQRFFSTPYLHDFD